MHYTRTACSFRKRREQRAPGGRESHGLYGSAPWVHGFLAQVNAVNDGALILAAPRQRLEKTSTSSRLAAALNFISYKQDSYGNPQRELAFWFVVKNARALLDMNKQQPVRI